MFQMGGVWGSFCLIFFAAVGAYMGAYLKRKGENLATSEDVERLTRLVEDVKHENTILVEQFKATQTHRFLLASERMGALQTAFVHWRTIFDSLRSEQFPLRIKEAKQWWNEHCLYLDNPARQAFIQGMSSIELGVEQRKRGNEMSDKLWKDFWSVPDAIFKAAGLPPLAREEFPSRDS